MSFVDIFPPLVVLRRPSRTPFPTFGGSLSSLLQRLRGPSWKSFSLFLEILFPFPTFGGSLSSLLQPLSGPSWSFVDNSFSLRALRGSPSWISFSLSVFLRGPSRTPFESFPTPWSPFADPLPDLWRVPLEPPPTPSWPFAVLRGPSWKPFSLFLEILSPLPDLWRIPLEPPPTPSWPFTDPFRVFSNPLEFLRGPPARPLADPSRAFSNPLVALRRSSWPFVEIFFSSCLFVVLRAPSYPFVDPFVDNRDNVPSLQAAPGTFPHLC